MSEMYKKKCGALNSFKHSLVFVFAIGGFVAISAFALLVDTTVGIVNSAVWFKK